jgi:predicted dehydrogenase
MGNKLKFLVVGCGAIGAKHARLAAEKGVLVAVCDIDEKKVKAFSKKYGCYGYTSLSAMLEKETADMLVVCTPNGWHAAQSIAALKKGLHVLCEKPMALSAADCRKMIATAKRYNRKLFVVKQNRYNRPVVLVKELLAKNKLGKICSFQLTCAWNRSNKYYQQSDWRGTPQMDGGVLFTQFSHFIDLLYWYFGEMNVVSALTQNSLHRRVSRLEDEGMAILTSIKGIPGTLHYTLNAYKKNKEGSLTIFGEKGTVKIGGQYLNTLEYFEVKGMKKPNLPPSLPANDYGYYQGSMSNHEAVYDNLLQVLSGKSKTYVRGEDGIKSVELIEAIYRKKGRKLGK